MANLITLVEFDPIESKLELKKFIALSWSLNKNDPAWVPPLRLAVLESLDKKKNPFYKHAQIRLWNAYKGKEHVGRIAAVIDSVHNSYHKESTGFWGYFEAIDDSSVAKTLFSAAEAWLKSRGMKQSRGPINPSLNHECGMLVSGFESSPYIMMTHNLRYYPQLVEGAGYSKCKDLFAYQMTPDDFSERVIRISEKVKAKTRVEIRPINMKKFMEEAQYIREIFNDAWSENWGFVPMNDEEFRFMAKSMKDIIWPEFCLLAILDGKPIGFSLTLPDVNQVFKTIPSGKLLPFGIFKLLRGIRRSAGVINRVRVITLGVKKKYRSTGIASIFYTETMQACRKLGLWGGEMSWILEDNRDMNSSIQAFSGKSPYKLYRIYEKQL